ncbi:MAG: hypothetical protein ACK4NA_03720 [Alphaproteobacteria bacterium]
MADNDLTPVPHVQSSQDDPVVSAAAEPASALNRRQALAKLGLAAGTAYAAPTLLSLTEAKAQGGPPWGRPSRPGEPDEPKQKG